MARQSTTFKLTKKYNALIERWIEANAPHGVIVRQHGVERGIISVADGMLIDDEGRLIPYKDVTIPRSTIPTLVADLDVKQIVAA